MRRLAALVACLFAACVFVPPAHAACPKGLSQMGCSIVAPARAARIVTLNPSAAAPTGEDLADVSSYQPNVNWASVKAWQLLHGWKLTGGIFKLGENVADPYALQNATDLHAAGMIAIGYWFIRPTGATEEGGKILAEASALHIHVVVLDEEVAGIGGYASVIAPILQKAGYTVVDYHSAENVLDSTATGLRCWVADYGPLRPPRCTTGKRVAWQWTDTGEIPGISSLVDVSVSYGLLRLAEPAPASKPTKLVCFGPGTTPPSTRCEPIVTHHAWLVSRRIHWGLVMFVNRTRKHSTVYRHAAHWYFLRRGQAVKLDRRYS